MFESLIGLAGLLFLILIHEWGHFIVGRIFGLGVRTFSVGFPIPGLGPLWSIKRGPTEYKINPLLILGGYCRFVMGKEVKNMPDAERERLAREFPEQLAMLEDESNWAENKPLYAQICVVLAGVTVNLICALLLLIGINGFVGNVSEIGAPSVRTVVAGSLADQAGIQENDTIIRIGNRDVNDIRGAIGAIQSQAGKGFTVTVNRSGSEVIIQVPEPVQRVRAPLGVVLEPQTESKAYSVGELLSTSTDQFIAQVSLVATGLTTMPQRLYELYFSKAAEPAPMEKEGTGMFSFIGQMGSVLRDNGWLAFLSLLVTLNIFLALFNLLPLPMLDGGLLVYLISLRFAGLFGTGARKAVAKVYGMLALIMLFLFIFILLMGLLDDAGALFG